MIDLNKWLYYKDLRVGNVYYCFEKFPAYNNKNGNDLSKIILITKLHGYSFEGIICNSKILKDILPRYDFYNLQQ